MARQPMMQDKVIDILRGDPNRPKRVKIHGKELNVYIDGTGNYVVQANGRTVHTGDGGRTAAETHVKKLVTSMAAKGIATTVNYYD